MEKRLKDPSAEVVLTCLEERYLKNEVMLDHHCFVRVISGEVKIVQSDTSQLFGPGDTILFPRRQLSTIIQYPKDDQPYKCVLVILKDNRLKDYYARNPANKSIARSSVIHAYNRHPLLESYFASLLPYFDLQQDLPEKLVALKIEEALTILRTLDVHVDTFLADLSEPGKIDLVGFMEQNYLFNMPLEKFSFLTGRSLTTFKRDFRKIYGVTPQRWLTEKRLQLAHYLLADGQKRPVEVYREAGFENLSHFSYAFKKQYGYAPKSLPGVR
ncbi:helix-turn-helix transcriptional regulator [Mucilaginibacter sp. Bleaf8]|uniref:helix-turn-helix domain-containing protein n=1 Tax=Mucilaginibacter sp. Bleaf8 TaxID=2834430 RepID=UPI001BCDDAE2|nr:AraC family transcriptional regulator [Mucilaginibacter sp. Bleaf8]MBS7563015.1 helix-turn-helix transcriptional regulator [Mucilaginibacter sp. Bleaf8]